MNKKLKNIFLNENKLPRLIWVEVEDPISLKKKVGKYKFIPSGVDENTGACHHVTLVFKPSEQEYFFIQSLVDDNETLEIKIEKRCSDSNIEALQCRLFKMNGDEIIIPNKILHITVSSKPGIPAKQSNDMLKNPSECQEFKLTIFGKVKVIL
jgi:hypothetical protein